MVSLVLSGGIKPMNRRLPSTLLAGLFPFVIAAHAFADDPLPRRSHSHVPIPPSITSPDQAQFLAQQLRLAQQAGGLQKMLEDRDLRRLVGDVQRNPEKYGLKEDLDKLHQQGGDFDLNDPRLRQLINRVLQQQSGGVTIPHEKLEEWKDWLDRFGGNGTVPPDLGSGDPDRSPAGKNPAGESPSDPQHSSSIPAPPSPPPTGTPAGAPTAQASPPPEIPPAQQAQNRVSEELMKFAEKLRDLDTPLQKSPAWQHFIQDLEHSVTKHAGSNSALADKARGLTDRLPPLSQYLPLDRLKGDKGLSQWGKSLVPKPPAVNWGNAPKTPVTAGWHVPHLSRAGLGDGGDWKDTLWLLMLLALAAFVVAALVWRRRQQARRASTGWKLGPWPVNPAAVRTRDELVRAFEYLSLLRLGPSARSRNHLEIADRLGHGAAWQLARAYEQARYTPPAEALPEAELATARRHLTMLAGAPSA
jgi:hypothetical protein